MVSSLRIGFQTQTPPVPSFSSSFPAASSTHLQANTRRCDSAPLQCDSFQRPNLSTNEIRRTILPCCFQFLLEALHLGCEHKPQMSWHNLLRVIAKGRHRAIGSYLCPNVECEAKTRCVTPIGLLPGRQLT